MVRIMCLRTSIMRCMSSGDILDIIFCAACIICGFMISAPTLLERVGRGDVTPGARACRR